MSREIQSSGQSFTLPKKMFQSFQVVATTAMVTIVASGSPTAIMQPPSRTNLFIDTENINMDMSDIFTPELLKSIDSDKFLADMRRVNNNLSSSLLNINDSRSVALLDEFAPTTQANWNPRRIIDQSSNRIIETTHNHEPYNQPEIQQSLPVKGGRQAFINQIQDRDWSKGEASEVITTLEEALHLGLPQLAVHLAQIGSKLFPEDARIQQVSRILAPPVIHISKASASNLETSRRWLLEHSKDYSGQWVAVKNGSLLGVEHSLKELLGKYSMVIDKKDTIVTKVL